LKRKKKKNNEFINIKLELSFNTEIFSLSRNINFTQCRDS
jgi:hypothetical protein